MTDAETQIARSLVTIPGWCWLPGMRAVHLDGRWFRAEMVYVRLTGDWRYALPDLSDTLTALGVLHLVRLAWGDPYVSVAYEPEDGHWYVYGRENDGPMLGHADTEIKALAAALGAATVAT